MRTLVLLACLIGTSMTAQDKAAQKILDPVVAIYDDYNSIQVHLDMEVTLAEKAPTRSEVVITQQGDQFVMEHPEQSMYCNGNDLWLFLPEHNEVQINDYEKDEDEGMISPLDIMDQYKNGKYKYRLIQNRKQRAEIEFLPISDESDYSKYRLVVNTTKHSIDQVEALGKDGSKVVLTIKKLIPNQTYAASFFTFDSDAHPGVRVEDLRLD